MKSMIQKSMIISIRVMIATIIYIFSLDDDNEEPENYSLEDIKTKLMVLDEKIADEMWFI